MTDRRIRRAAADGRPRPPATLDDLMLAMDVVDTLRHRERLVERELDEDVRDEQLIERLRELYKSQGIEVPDRIIEEGVKALKESRFVYTPPPPSFARTLATFWVQRGDLRQAGSATAVAVLASLSASIISASCGRASRRPKPRGSSSRETLPRAARCAAPGDRRRSAGSRGAAAGRRDPGAGPRRPRARQRRRKHARRSPSSTSWRPRCGRNTCSGSPAGREDQTGFFREHPSFQGRAYFIVVDAVDPRGQSGQASRSATTRPTRPRPCRALPCAFRSRPSMPCATTRRRTASCRTPSMAEKRRGFLEPEFRMPALEGRITRW